MSDGPVGVVVRVDPDDLDLERVHRWLSTDAYWARGRTRDVVQRAAAGSVNLAAEVGDELVGYARLVTDKARFAWLCDVYVDPAARGRGAGPALVERALALIEEWGVRRTLLATNDAHGLYERFGFVPFGEAEEVTRWMVRQGDAP